MDKGQQWEDLQKYLLMNSNIQCLVRKDNAIHNHNLIFYDYRFTWIKNVKQDWHSKLIKGISLGPQLKAREYPQIKVKQHTKYCDPKFCFVISAGLNSIDPIQQTNCSQLKIKDIKSNDRVGKKTNLQTSHEFSETKNQEFKKFKD